ncbi:MAG: hypothetical protein ACOVP7_08230 [Lacibacter sp.]
MKQILFMLACTCVTAISFAQTSFGIASFTVPLRWQSSEQNGSMILENPKATTGRCRIVITPAQNGIVNSADAHIQTRSKLSEGTYRYSTSLKAIVKTDVNGILIFGSAARAATKGESADVSYFYTYTNGQQSFTIQIISSSAECLATATAFLNSVQVLEPLTNVKAKRRKASPAAPAAPAPVM